ncbi:ribonuclease P protein subunit p25-like protein [Lineus longissimus]|uniref:ribonuclease P protein subunit p25-like protein n=1 Tax=Lineus longissimus TaxID=88925 RepID=UPI002B4E4FEF
MEHYEKQETRCVDDDSDEMPGILAGSVVHMKVNPGSKIRNLVEYAKRRIKERETKQLTWNGAGKGTSKAISCAEIFKRLVLPNIKLHQITKIKFKRVEEIWKPKVEGLDVLKVNVDIPAISILLSKEPLDSFEPGYQPPGPFDVYWRGKIEDENSSENKTQKSKRGARTSVGKPDVKFQKKQKSHQDSNRAASAAYGKKETKQRKNEKRRASEETRRDAKGDERNKDKTLKQSVDSKKETGSDGNRTLHQPVQVNINVEEPMES